MLNILLLDMLHEEEVNASDLLKAAYLQRDLPIKQLAIFNELSSPLQSPIEQITRFNVFIVSFSKPENKYIEFIKLLSLRSERIFIIFIVAKRTDIAFCARSPVQPARVLFLPLEKQHIYQPIEDIYKDIYIEYMRTQPVFTVKTRGEYFTINTGDISFFEAQGKKIAIKTPGQEILFYSNFETVLEQLPDWFIRCHKGYVVNTKLIVKASFTEMILKLKDQSVIPISRTYRDEIRSRIESIGG